MSTLLQKSQQILNEKTTKIIPENIKSGITAFGVEGSVVELNGETKSINPSISQQIILPSTNKNAITQVTVNAVTNAIDNNIQSENIKKDVTILGVTGTYEGTGGSGEVKLFDTIQLMNNDSYAQEGDLAVVYRNELKGIEEHSQFSSCTFPNTVVLSSAYSGNDYCNFRAVDPNSYFDCMVDLDASHFRLDGYGDISVGVQYTSSDGITYTRTDGGDETIDFGTNLAFENYGEPFPSVLSNFMLIGGKCFEGFFQYEPYIDKEYFRLIPVSNIDFTDRNNIAWNGQYSNIKWSIAELQNVVNKLKEDGMLNFQAGSYNYFFIVQDEDDDLVLIKSSNSVPYPTGYIIDDNNEHIGNGAFSDKTIAGTTWSIYKLDTKNGTYSLKRTVTSSGNIGLFGWSGQTFATYDLKFNTLYVRVQANYNGTILDIVRFQDFFPFYFNNSLSSGTATQGTMSFRGDFWDKYNKYQVAKSQINAIPGDVVSGKNFYGKNGSEVGIFGVPDNTFRDTNAKAYADMQTMYDDMQIQVLSDAVPLGNIYCIPTKSDGTPLMDCSNVAAANGIFANTKITTIQSIDLSSATATYLMCQGNTNLRFVGSINVSSATELVGTFQGCSNLKNVWSIITGNGLTDIQSMFYQCSSLKAIPLFNTANVTNMYESFARCPLITSIPQFDTHSVTSFLYTFGYDSALIDIPILDTSSALNVDNMFIDCPNLSDTSLNNVLYMCANINPSYSRTKTLANLGLSSTQAQTCTGLSNWSAAQAAGWTTGY